MPFGKEFARIMRDGKTDIKFNVISALIELLMFISHGVWRYRTRHLHKAAKEAGVSYDDYPPAIEWQSKAWDVGFDKLQFGKRIKKVYKREKEVVAEDTTNQPEVATV